MAICGGTIFFRPFYGGGDEIYFVEFIGVRTFFEAVYGGAKILRSSLWKYENSTPFSHPALKRGPEGSLRDAG